MSAPWHGVELRHLAALRAVGAERSFRGAAERLGYVQSAVSQQISQLEALVGERLIERRRGHSSVALTEAGEVMLNHAERIHAELQAARAGLDALGGEAPQTLTVGATQSVAAKVLPATLALLYEREPSLRVEVRERTSDGGFFDALTAGELDLAFCELPVRDGGSLWAWPLFHDPCVLLVAADRGHPTEPVSLAEVAGLPLVSHPNWRFAELIEDQFRAKGLKLTYAAEADTNSATQALVASGRAAAIMPALAVANDDPDTVALELEPALPARTLALAVQGQRRDEPALCAFREAALDACADRFGEQMASPGGQRRAAQRARMRAAVHS